MTILVAMSETAYNQVISAESERRLASLGDVHLCLNGRTLTETDYASAWQHADVALTGWGVRPPSADLAADLPRLRAICHSAGSVRMFPRGLIETGVVVTSARAAIARTVAEFCLMCALSLLRRLPEHLALSRDSRNDRPPTRTLYGKTVTLFGLGHVARHFRELLRPFGVRVIAVDPYLAAEEAAKLGVELAPLTVALEEADVVSIHAPDIPGTRGLIGAGELALLRDGAVFINTARGRIVETQALTDTLATGRIYAALDVTDPEPLSADHPLRGLPNVALTPHVAGPTTDELPRLGEMAVEDLERIVRGRSPVWPIDLAAYDAMSF